MRGGTSKGLFFHERDLPGDRNEQDVLILAAFGSPDAFRRQIDGIGGAVSTTSKVAVIGDGTPYGVDVTYEFGQVGIDQPLVDRRGNCGNISSAVGPFAVDEGLVKVTEPVTQVRILNLNTNKVIVAHVPIRNGKFDPIGDFELPGVPGAGARLRMDYLDPGGAVTGRLLPTGNVRDSISVPELGDIEISMVDAANPVVFIRWETLGLTGQESVAEVDSDTALLVRLESVRAAASVLAGIAPDMESAASVAPSIPKLAIVGEPRSYTASNGAAIAPTSANLRAGMMSMGRMHNSYPLTGAIATTVASRIPGTLVHGSATATEGDFLIAHQAGVLPMSAEVEAAAEGFIVKRVSGYRTARRLMEGNVLIAEDRVQVSVS